MAELRSFIFLSRLQPQTMCYLGSSLGPVVAPEQQVRDQDRGKPLLRPCGTSGSTDRPCSLASEMTSVPHPSSRSSTPRS